jgi:hypothetical protein
LKQIDRGPTQQSLRLGLVVFVGLMEEWVGVFSILLESYSTCPLALNALYLNQK